MIDGEKTIDAEKVALTMRLKIAIKMLEEIESVEGYLVDTYPLKSLPKHWQKSYKRLSKKGKLPVRLIRLVLASETLNMLFELSGNQAWNKLRIWNK